MEGGYMCVIWNVAEVQRNRFHLIAEYWMTSPFFSSSSISPLSNRGADCMNWGIAAGLNVILQWSVCSMASFITYKSIPSIHITHPSGRSHLLSVWWPYSLYITKKDYRGKKEQQKCGWRYYTMALHFIICLACLQR